MSTTSPLPTAITPHQHTLPGTKHRPQPTIRTPGVLDSLSQQDAYREGYINYQQARLLGFTLTPQSLYEVMMTTILDVHHPHEHNTAYLLGWIAAYLHRDRRESESVQQNLLEASLLIEYAMLRVTEQEASQ